MILKWLRERVNWAWKQEKESTDIVTWNFYYEDVKDRPKVEAALKRYLKKFKTKRR